MKQEIEHVKIIAENKEMWGDVKYKQVTTCEYNPVLLGKTYRSIDKMYSVKFSTYDLTGHPSIVLYERTDRWWLSTTETHVTKDRYIEDKEFDNIIECIDKVLKDNIDLILEDIEDGNQRVEAFKKELKKFTDIKVPPYIFSGGKS